MTFVLCNAQLNCTLSAQFQLFVFSEINIIDYFYKFIAPMIVIHMGHFQAQLYDSIVSKDIIVHNASFSLLCFIFYNSFFPLCNTLKS